MTEDSPDFTPMEFIVLLISVAGAVVLAGGWFAGGFYAPEIIYGTAIHEWGMYWIFGPGVFGAIIFCTVALFLIAMIHLLRRVMKVQPTLVASGVVLGASIVSVLLWFIVSLYIAVAVTVRIYDLP